MVQIISSLKHHNVSEKSMDLQLNNITTYSVNTIKPITQTLWNLVPYILSV